MSIFSKCLRWILGLFSFGVGIVLVCLIAIFLYFDPNDFKPQITSFLQDKTGLPLQIQGNIGLTLYPYVGLDAEKIQLAQPLPESSGFFIRVDKIHFHIPLKDLLQRHLKIESLIVKEGEIHLIKYANGRTNWDHYTKQLQPAQKSTPTQTTTATPTQSRKKLTFALDQFELHNIKLTWDDKQEKQQIVVDHLFLKGQQPQILAKSYPIKGEFDFLIQKNAANFMQGHSQIEGNVVALKTFSGKTTLDLQLPPSLPWPKAHITMQLQVDPNKEIALDNVVFTVPTMNIQGKCKIPLAKLKPIQFSAVIDSLNLDTLTLNKPAAIAKPSTGNTKPTAVTTGNSTGPERALIGDVHIKQLVAKDLHLTNVKAALHLNNGILKLNPVTATLYQGTLSLQAQKNLQRPQAATTFQGKVENVELPALLKDLKQSQPVSGKANIQFNLNQTQQGLQGTTQFALKNGDVQGIDVMYYLSLAQSLLNKEKSPQTNQKVTPFNAITGTLKINHNVIYNNDLLLSAPDFSAKGEGSIQLDAKTLEYKIRAWREYHDNQEHPNAYPLAIRLKGKIASPKIEPDLDVYVKMALERELKKEVKKQVEKQVSKQIEKHLGKILAENGSEDDEASVEDKIQQKLEEKINKGLKKLFK